MHTSLVVPVHLDALYLHEARYVTESMADFTRLPYFDAELGRDINPNTPYLSEAILSKPFQDQRLRLKAGIHLHWSLPDALTCAKHNNGATTFLTVPNRWLITRSRQGDDQSFRLDKQWVVESDFLSEENPGSVNYPYISGQISPTSSGCPFRYLGRKVPLEAWQAGTTGNSYLTSLTAVGYGEPTFAAFYPNCHSVFGFHDADHDAKVLQKQLRYDVVGWYSKPGDDELHKLGKLGSSWKTDIQDAFGWTVSQGDQPPERILCYAQITFKPVSDSPPEHPNIARETGVSVGNTATEALAAHLSHHFAGIKPDELEDLLEALPLADHLEQKRLDVGPKFKEKRHTSTFQALTPERLWTIRRKGNITSEDERADVALAQQREDLRLPNNLAQVLDRLNRIQVLYDRTQQELDDRRTQLFADWYKYMVCVYPPEISRESYPDIDEVKYFIQTKDLDPIHYLQTATGLFQLNSEGNVQEPSDDIGTTIAHRLKQAYNQVKQLLDTENQSTKAQDAKAELILQEIAAPRHYVPNEPVVLFTGDAATPTNRHGQDGRLHPEGLLECLVIDNDNLSFDNTDNINKIRDNIVDGFANISEDQSIAFNTWKQQPWHPILLQWEVEFFPTRDGNNLTAGNRRYQQNFIEQNYSLAEKDVELRIKPDKIPPTKATSVYSGTTILSPTAQPVLSERILIYLKKHLLSAYYQAKDIPETDQKETYFEEHLSVILSWYTTDGKNNKFKLLIDVYNHLKATSGSNLSQTLGGFNDALIMHKVTRQTPIADPIGFEPYRSFTEQEVSQAIGPQHMIRAPQPLNDFNPIRAGALKLLRLRLIDNFGIVHDVNVDDMTTTQQLRLVGHPDWVAMLPRLTQPARVDFRWLAADQDIYETNGHPLTTPICGWLLPNHLDQSLAVYDQIGHALGALYALPDPQNTNLAQWRSAPGQVKDVEISTLHPDLRKVITYIQAKGSTFVGDFLAAMDSALASIDPESYSQHRSQAVLIGRPVAVVRAKVDLHLLGTPAINQAWNTFRQDLHRNSRETNGFTQVRFPIRIGEYHQLNDGLVGYWEEGENGQINNSPFYAAQSDSNSADSIVTYDGEPITLKQSLSDPPQYLTMLFDPRGVVHATTGILPTKSIAIPADQYRDALRNIEVTFFSAPILSEANQLDLPLPRESGYLWSWLQKDAEEQWTEFSTLRTIRRSVFVAAMGEGGDTVWSELLRQGWLNSLDDETALVVAEDKRPSLSQALDTQRAQIEKNLEHPTVDPARLQAHFLSRPTVREGWLKLRKSPVIQE